MVYTIYDITDRVPPPDVNSIWAVLLFGDRVYMTVGSGLIFVMYSDFAYQSEESKFKGYSFFKDKISEAVSWPAVEAAIADIKMLRKRKQKNALELKVLRDHEVWLRKFEKSFLIMLGDFLK